MMVYDDFLVKENTAVDREKNVRDFTQHIADEFKLTMETMENEIYSLQKSLAITGITIFLN